MSTSNPVYLGQKNSVAKFDLETKNAIWSVETDGYPGIISCYDNKLFVQGANNWSKYFHLMLNAETGALIWSADKDAIKSYITPHY